VATQFMDQISHAWQFLLMLGAGTGLVYILRWYWWRVNAWSEVSAMAAALIVSLSLRNFMDAASPRGFAVSLIITTLATTVVWLVVTMFTQPEPRATLDAFYAKVRPAGPGWGVVAREIGIEPVRGELSRNAVAWVAGVVMVYSIMFTTGAVIFHYPRQIMIFGGALVVSASVLMVVMRGERAETDHPQMTQMERR